MRLLFAGDVMLGRLVNGVLRREPPEFPWGDTLPLFAAADVPICNLECVLADGGEPWSATPKVFHFRSDAKNVAALRAAGIRAVSLANNHTLDFGYGALGDMLATLDAAGIAHAGAGRTLEEAERPAIFEVGGATIALLACTDNEPIWEAAADRPGTFYAPVALQDPRVARLLALVRETRPRVVLLVVALHWGPNWGHVPPLEHVPFAHALIEAGADVVVGHSGHVCRGVEIYRGRPILYCAGDFVDDYAVDPAERNDRSCLFSLDTDGPEGWRLRLHPTVIRDFQARLAAGDEADAIAAHLRQLSAALGTALTWRADAGYLESAPFTNA